MEDLEALLRRHKGRKRFIVTDGVFSMDGDLCPLPILFSLAQRFEATLIIDDAHATGVVGEKGKGSLEYWGLDADQAIQVGTFSKAIGTQGGFVCGKKILIDYLVNKARPFIFSTALPPPVVAATKTAIQIIENANDLRHKLLRLTTILRDGLKDLGFPIPTLPTPIIPLVVGDTQETIRLSQHLFQNGLFTPPIRPPTVPEGKSRLRISLSALHSEEDIGRLIDAIEGFFKRGA
jgi:7-keto-8-aminopelargonate synthetase-like enzyme